jgi:hypothetical protein
MHKLRHRINQWLAAFGYQLEGIRYCPRQLLDTTLLRCLEFDDVVCRRMFEVGLDLNFIQVGAFDGITKDPLHKYIQPCGWRGVLVEPSPAAQLRQLYSDNENRGHSRGCSR